MLEGDKLWVSNFIEQLVVISRRVEVFEFFRPLCGYSVEGFGSQLTGNHENPKRPPLRSTKPKNHKEI